MITKTCPGCGKEFRVKPYLQDRIKFCSKECRYKHVYPESGYKRCYLCGETKPLDAFSLMSPTKHVSGKGRQMACKECAIEQQRNRRQAMPEKPRSQCRDHYKKDPVYFWAQSSISQHRKKGFEIDFTARELRQYIKVHDIKTCNICGKSIIWGQHKGRCVHDSPTIDRSENGKTMTLESIQIVCMTCNTTKGPRSMSEFVAYCKTVAEKFG